MLFGNFNHFPRAISTLLGVFVQREKPVPFVTWILSTATRQLVKMAASVLDQPPTTQVSLLPQNVSMPMYLSVCVHLRLLVRHVAEARTSVCRSLAKMAELAFGILAATERFRRNAHAWRAILGRAAKHWQTIVEVRRSAEMAVYVSRGLGNRIQVRIDSNLG